MDALGAPGNGDEKSSVDEIFEKGVGALGPLRGTVWEPSGLSGDYVKGVAQRWPRFDAASREGRRGARLRALHPCAG